MKQIIISDIHTPKNFEKIYNFLTNKFLNNNKIDSIFINGDFLGIFSIKKEYGENYNHSSFIQSLNKKELLIKAAPKTAKKLLESQNPNKQLIKQYILERYNWIISCLKKLSKLRKTYFNIGNHESPFYNLVLTELSFLLNKSIPQINTFPLFESFISKLKQLEKTHNFTHISNKIIKENNTLIAAIPGLSHSSFPQDKFTQTQERITAKLTQNILTQLKNIDTLIIYNHTEHPLTKLGSKSMLKFFNKLKNKNIKKIFINSHNHIMTTRFYKHFGFYHIHNNAAVNNSLFNIIGINNQISCYDVDPNLNKIRKLSIYNYKDTPKDPIQRLKLNYSDTDQLIKERNLNKDITYL